MLVLTGTAWKCIQAKINNVIHITGRFSLSTKNKSVYL